jgi:hypothetical protein
MISTILCGFIFVVLGAIGGTTAVSRWWRGYIGFRILHIPWGFYYAFALFITGLTAVGGIRQLDGMLALFIAALMPFALLGSVMWAFAFGMELVAGAAASKNMHIEPTYDIGDGLLVRHKFAEAEAAFRLYLAAHPTDLPVLLRISRAQISDGRLEQAVRELELARKNAIDRTDSATPPCAELLQKLQEKEFRQDRILRLTFTLGDIFVEKLCDHPRAIKLYEESLQVLYGYPPADPLRDRLKALNNPDRMTLSDAVDQAQPRKISLTD